MRASEFLSYKNWVVVGDVLNYCMENGIKAVQGCALVELGNR